MVSEIVNLNKFKKIHNRKLKKCQSEINLVKFGQTKVEKINNESEAQREDKELSGKQLGDDGSDIA
jgi:hypothetical protein